MNQRNPARLSIRKQNKKVIESDESSVSDSNSDSYDSSDLVLSDSDESQFRKKVNKIAMKSSSSRMGIVRALGASDVQGYYQVLQSVDDELKDLSDQVRKLQSEVLADKPKRSPNKPNLPENSYLVQQPKSLQGGQLKTYQLAGLNWMISLYEKYLNGILADQMGLGKTIQTIGFISYLADKYKIRGPHVIIAPLTTVRNWMREFGIWLPNCKAMILEATMEKREDQIKMFIKEKMEVIITSYESVRYNHDFFVGLKIHLLVVDEAHKMKNEEAQFSQLMRHLKSRFKLLLTGTPIHNNTQELWALLNFIMPEIFHNATLFTDWTDVNNQMSKNSIFEPALQKMNMDMITRLRNIISPFMLRRTKDEVEKQIPAKKEIHIYVQLSPLQKEQYKQILFQLDPHRYYQNKLMHLRKLCVHPYCFPELDTEENDIDEHIVYNCGKLRFLDKLLERLLRQNHKVLIFSQFKMMLDILEDYLNLRQYKYRRIDGETPVDERELYIQEFQAPNSKLQIFILSTRAGGLGITLTAANQVVIYDSDFNPQMDLQAMDRAHRIGQTKEVTVYRLAHRSTIEEMIIERQQIKMRWDTLIIGKEGKVGFMNSQNFDKLDLNDLFKNADELIDDKPFTDEDIDTILRVSEEKFQALNKRLDQKFEDLQKKLDEQVQLGLKSMNLMQHFQSKEKDFVITSQLISKMRQQDKSKKGKTEIRQQNVSFDEIKQIYQHDYYNFYDNNKRIIQLKQKQLDYDVFEEAVDEGKNIIDIEDIMIEDLSEKENQELSELLESGFGWKQQDYQQFISAFKEFGYQPQEIQKKMKNDPSIKDIEKYLNVFTNRCSEIPEGEVDLMIVQKNMKERIIQSEMTDLLGQLIKIIKFNKDDIKNESLMFIKNQFNSQEIRKHTNEQFISKPKGLYQITTEDFDFTLLDTAFKHGYGKWDLIGKNLKENKFQDDESFVIGECIKYLKYLTDMVMEKFKVLIKIDDHHLKIVIEKFGLKKSSLQTLVHELDVKQEEIQQKKSKGKKIIRKQQPQKEQAQKEEPEKEQAQKEKGKPENKQQDQKKKNNKKDSKKDSKSQSKNKSQPREQQEQKPKAKAQPRNKSEKNANDSKNQNQQLLKVVKKPLKARDESQSPDVVDKAVKKIVKKPKK